MNANQETLVLIFDYLLLAVYLSAIGFTVGALLVAVQGAIKGK